MGNENRFTTNVERSGDVTVVKCQGELVSGTMQILYAEIQRLIPDGKKIVLDLQDLKRIDSMGIGMLARLYASCKSKKCDFQLVNVRGRIEQILGITNLLSVLAAAGDRNTPIH